MTSLYDLYREVQSKLGIDLTNFLAFPNEKSASEVIEGYFDKHCKSILFDFLPIEEKELSKYRAVHREIDLSLSEEKKSLEYRSVHMVSAFLFGLSLDSKLKIYIPRINPDDSGLTNVFRTDETSDGWCFQYLWFLSCLFHDEYEYSEGTKYKGIDSLDKALNDELIKISPDELYDKKIYTIYDRQNDKQDDKQILDISGKFVKLPEPTYPENDVISYFKYRLTTRRRTVKGRDHGILGGYIEFQKLVQSNMRNRKASCKAKTGYTLLESHYYKDNNKDKKNYVIWDKNQIEAYALIADALIAHNIWFATKRKRIEDYNKNNLTRFTKGNKGIDFKCSPLAYILSLVDTIEPVKFYESEKRTNNKVYTYSDRSDSLEIIELLKYLTLDVKSGEIIIGHNPVELSFPDLFSIKGWYTKRMKRMSDWLEGTSASYCKATDTITIKTDMPMVLK